MCTKLTKQGVVTFCNQKFFAIFFICKLGIIPQLVGFLSKNPNIETPFEDSVPKKDVEFIKEYLHQDKELSKDVIVPKDEQLTEKEIAAYTSIDKAFAEDHKIEKKLLKEVKKLSKKTEEDKESNKKAKSKKQKA